MKKKKLYKIFTFLSLLALFFINGCKKDDDGIVEDSKEFAGTIKVGHLVALDMAPLFIAKEEGFFVEQGLDIETIFFSNPGDNNAALAGGSIQFSVNPFTLPFLGDNAGIPMRIISSAGGLGIIEVVAHKDINIKSMEELTNYVSKKENPKLKVGSLKGDTLDMILYKSFADNNMSYDDFEMVWFNDLLAMVQTFQTGQIDILSHIKPYTTDLVINNDAIVLTNNSEVWGYGTPNCTVAVLQPFLDKYPQTVKKYLKAIEKAFALMIREPKRAAEILTQGNYYKVDKDVLLYALSSQPKEVVLKPNVEGMFIALNDMVSQGYIDSPSKEIIKTEILEGVSKK